MSLYLFKRREAGGPWRLVKAVPLARPKTARPVSYRVGTGSTEIGVVEETDERRARARLEEPSSARAWRPDAFAQAFFKAKN